MTALDEQDIQENYKTNVNIDIGISGLEEFTGSFKASSEYKHEADTVNNKKRGTATATSSCIAHTYSLKKVLPPCMSNELMAFVEVMLEDPDDKDQMNDFFD